MRLLKSIRNKSIEITKGIPAVKKACLAVLNYNGIEHLENLLPSLIEAQKRGTESNIIILDNQSTEDDVAWTRQNFPNVEVVVAPENACLLSYNWLARQITDDILVVLNNDLKVDREFIRWMLLHFEKPDVFAVTGCQMDWEGKAPLFGPCTLKRHRGWYWFDFDKACQVPAYTLFGSGGFSAIDRLKFVRLGGFDPLYHPGYCEDVDLCFRAWGKGWKSIYEPRAITRHRESGSFGKRANRLNLERMFLFHWRNLRHQPFYAYHWMYVLWSLRKRRKMGDTDWIEAYKTAREIWGQRGREALKNRPGKQALQNCMKHCGRPL